MSETYARGGQESTGAGGFILVVASLLAAVLVLAGLIYAAGTPARHRAALAAAGCEPSLSPAGVQCTTAQMLTKRFLAIMVPARQQLSADQAAYTAAERRRNLAAAQSALTAEVTSEHTFDTSLAGVTFPPAVAAIAKALIRANEARATLTAKQAQFDFARPAEVVQPPGCPGRRRCGEGRKAHPQGPCVAISGGLSRRGRRQGDPGKRVRTGLKLCNDPVRSGKGVR